MIRFFDRSSDCNDVQNCKDSGNVPASENSGNWSEINRFSFSFQHDTPSNLHNDEVDELENVQEVSFDRVSVSEDLRP